MAQRRASRPNPLPGSLTTLTSPGAPSGRTSTCTVTYASSICAVSDSGGNGQFHSAPPPREADRVRSGPAGAGGVLGAPVPPGTPVGLVSDRTALVPVPFADVRPPGKSVAFPVTIVFAVRSTGSFGSGSRVNTFAACAGLGGGGGASCGARGGGARSSLASGSACGGGGGGGSSFITSISPGAVANARSRIVCTQATTLASAIRPTMRSVPPEVKPNHARNVDVLASSPSTLRIGSS